VYVFTPRGDIVELPSGATVLDLAYAIHTDVGHQAVVAKVDRQFASLSAKLKSGQTVEVITSPNNQPTKNWLDIVQTGKAKSGIKHFLRTRHRESLIILGGRILKKAMVESGIDMDDLDDKAWAKITKKTEVKTKDDVLHDIALGMRTTSEVIALYLDTKEEDPPKDIPLSIHGSEGMAVEYASCCYPVPGDAITGILRVGKGVVVHQSTCPQLLKAIRSKSQVMSVSWADNIVGEYRVNLQVETLNQRGVLAMMALAVSDAKANIDDIVVENHTEQHAVVILKLKVTDKAQLMSVIRRIERVKLVMNVKRHPV
jgi:guanosine-3',5'-bis(diphosphate) 3'-pyrophosphohydrolase